MRASKNKKSLIHFEDTILYFGTLIVTQCVTIAQRHSIFVQYKLDGKVRRIVSFIVYFAPASLYIVVSK